MLSNTIKKTAKKLFSGKYKGLFMLLDINQYAISFKNINGVVFSYQSGPDIENFFNLFPGCGFLSAGYVKEGTIYGPTYESEYNTYGPIQTAEYNAFYQEPTDNPDFIKRTALHITLN